MEKIFFKPTAQEILYKTSEPQSHSDSFEYGATDAKSKHLGHLYVVGHLKYGEENMAYVLSLLASLANREYYSENGNIQEDPKKAFDLALKKLNDVLEDFFKKNDFKLNLGLLAIAGDNLYISKLGKFKVLLARGGEMIDILNNVDLFQRESTQEKKFSNIVSGKIKEGDKLFALYPNRSTVSREKGIKTALVNCDQERFLAELVNYSQTSKNFSCNGYHIEIKKVKESGTPPIRSAYERAKLVALTPPSTENSSPVVQTSVRSAPNPVHTEPEPQEQSEENEDNGQGQDEGSAKVISSQMSLAKRSGLWGKTLNKFSPRSFGGSRRNGDWKIYYLAGIVAVLALTGGKIYWDKSHQTVFNSINENIKLAETKITKNDPDGARELLGLSLSSLLANDQTGKKAEDLKNRINSLLDRLDLVSGKQPELFSSSDTPVVSGIGFGNGILTALGKDQKVYKFKEDGSASEISSLTALEPEVKFAFGDSKYFSAYNGTDQFGSLDLASKKYSVYKLKETDPVKDAVIYEGNLYLLGNKAIYKYGDINQGAGGRQLWLGGLTDPGQQSIAVDGNVYVLNQDGTVIKYFKGKEESRVKLSIASAENFKLLTSKDSPYFYLADYQAKKIRVFDKLNGSLVLTYKAAALDSLQSALLADNFLYLLDGNGKIWKLVTN